MLGTISIWVALNGSLFAIDGSTGNIRWSIAIPICSSPAVDVNNIVYVGSVVEVYAIDGLNGKVRWTYHPIGSGQFKSSPRYWNRRNAVYRKRRRFSLLSQWFHRELRWRYQTGRWVDSSPTIGEHNIVYVQNGVDQLVAVDGTTGALIGTTACLQPHSDNYNYGSPHSARTTLYMPWPWGLVILLHSMQLRGVVMAIH